MISGHRYLREATGGPGGLVILLRQNLRKQGTMLLGLFMHIEHNWIDLEDAHEATSPQ